MQDKEIKMPVNPYPEHMFNEPSKEQFDLFHKVLKENGTTLDAFSGSFGRNIWKAFTKQFKEYHAQEISKLKVKFKRVMLNENKLITIMKRACNNTSDEDCMGKTCDRCKAEAIHAKQAEKIKKILEE